MLKYLKKLLGSPDRDEFAKLMIEEFRTGGVAGDIEYDSDSFRLILPRERQFFLANAYGDYCRADRKTKREVLRRYAIVDIPSVPSSWDEASHALLPVVREGSFFTLGSLRSKAEGGPPKEIAFRPLSSHLGVGLAYDGPSTISYINLDAIAGWNVTFDDALDHARENLWKMSNGRFERPLPGFYIAPWRDNYTVSRLFLPQLIWNLNVNGDHVAVAPTRDDLLITGSEDLDGLTTLLEVCGKLENASHRVSSVPVVLRENEWETYRPESDHPLSGQFRRLRILDESARYDEQKQLLEKWHERTGEDIFVASYVVTENKKTGELSSYAVWAEGVLTLLPEAESVVFVRSDKKVAGKAPWRRVIESCGELMSRADLLPVRYRVEAFPAQPKLSDIVEAL